MRKYTTLVAGGAGFVGSHLCRRLLADGKRVVCIDNLSTGQATNIEALQANPSFDFILLDVVKPLHVDYAVDEIYSLACPASPIHYQKDPVNKNLQDKHHWKHQSFGTCTRKTCTHFTCLNQ